MPLDPKIILGIKPVQLSSPIEMQEQALRLKSLTQSTDEIDRKKMEDRTIKDLLKKNVGTDQKGKTNIDRSAFISELTKVDPQKAMEYDDIFRGRDLAKMEQETKLAKNLAWSATPENWSSIRQKAIEAGLPNAEQLPSVYMRSFVQRWQLAVMSGEEQLTQKNKQQELDLMGREIGAKETEAAAKFRESGGDGGPGKITEAQSKSLGFGRRAMIADQMIEQIMSDPNANVSSLKTQIKSSLPKWMGGIKNQREQDIATAKTSFVASVLRKESGAAVTPQEFETYDRMYFPQPGDSRETLANKSVLRKNFIDTEKMTAGRAWRDPIPLKGPQQKQVPEGDVFKEVAGRGRYKKVPGGWIQVP
jgi:hypothetical protein